MPIFDERGTKVGTVRRYSAAAGYLMVNVDVLRDQDLYIPFRLIRTIDPREIFLSAPKATLVAQYTQPPMVRTVIETRSVPGTDGSMTPQTQQVRVLTSGYDATPAAVDSTSLEPIASRLAVGMVVYDVDGVRLGSITHYDTERGRMVVGKGTHTPSTVVVPLSDIASFTEDNLAVYLKLTKETVVKESTSLSQGGSGAA
jgi:hypothetical protein